MILADTGAIPNDSDVCVVGAGPVGLALAFKLESLGLTVTLLEMGGGSNAESSSRADVEFRNGHHAASAAVSRPGIGGTSALWGGRCVAFDDLDFERREHVPHSGWPISHAEISRYYHEAFAFLGCSVEDLRPIDFGVSDASVRTDAVERWSRQPSLGPVYAERLAASAHIHVLPEACVTEILLEADQQQVQALKVRRRGQTFEVSAKHYVLAGGGLENARLLLALAERSPPLAAAAGPTLGGFYQGHLTGYIALLQLDKPRDALALTFRKDSKGLSIRQRLQIAPAMQLDRQLLNTVFWIDAISIADPVHGSGVLSVCYLFLAATGLYRRMSRGLAPTARGLRHIDKKRHWKNVKEDLRSPGALLRAAGLLLRRRAAGDRHTLINPKGRYLLRYHAEQVPNPESRVALRRSNDPQAPAALSVDYRVVDQDIDSVLQSHDIIDDWLRRNGLGRLEYLHDASHRRQAVMDQAFDGYHQIGLTRMASDPSEGPADTDCRFRGVSNLHLGGSCLFPTGGHANPTLPAVALALRLAVHLREMAVTTASETREAGDAAA